MARKAHPIRPTQPFLNHETLTQDQQAKFLGVKEETTMNLGHPVPISRITENPVGYPVDYQSPSAARVINETRSQGVYGRFRDPKDGTSTAENLSRWSDYAKSNSYTGHGNKAGTGKDPSMPDPRTGRGSNASDGYLAPLPKPSTSNWANYTAGGDSGEGRLQKIGKR